MLHEHLFPALNEKNICWWKFLKKEIVNHDDSNNIQYLNMTM